jgi:hypothetical protein
MDALQVFSWRMLDEKHQQHHHLCLHVMELLVINATMIRLPPSSRHYALILSPPTGAEMGGWPDQVEGPSDVPFSKNYPKVILSQQLSFSPSPSPSLSLSCHVI